MKKILSIAAISVFSTAILSVGANAASSCPTSFEGYLERLKNSENFKCIDFSLSDAFCDDMDIIKELLKDCECKILDNLPSVPEFKPEEDKPEVDVPEQEVVPEKPEIETPEQETVPEKPETSLPEQDTTPDKPSDDTQDIIPDNNIQNDNSGTVTDSYISQVLDLVNKERKANGLSPVTATNNSLNSAAQKRASEQSVSFSHTRPDGRSWSSVLSDFNVSYRTAGENVAYGQSTPAEVMNAWMNSSGHRANILNSAYSEIGIGVYKKNGTYYWSQLFIG